MDIIILGVAIHLALSGDHTARILPCSNDDDTFISVMVEGFGEVLLTAYKGWTPATLTIKGCEAHAGEESVEDNTVLYIDGGAFYAFQQQVRQAHAALCVQLRTIDTGTFEWERVSALARWSEGLI